MNNLTMIKFLTHTVFFLSSFITLSSSEQICNIFCDGRNSTEANQPFQALSTVHFGRKITLFLSIQDKMGFAELSNGEPTDEVWLDRSFDLGQSWIGRLGNRAIHSGKEMRTTLFNIDKPLVTRQIWGCLRACGNKGGKEHACTQWFRSPSAPTFENSVFREAASIPLLGRWIKLFISDANKIAYAQLSNGTSSDETWIDRSFDNGDGWDGRLGNKIMPELFHEVRSDVVDTEILPNGPKAVLRACGNQEGRSDVLACTPWTTTVNDVVTTTTTNPPLEPASSSTQIFNGTATATENPTASQTYGHSNTDTLIIATSIISVALVVLIIVVVCMYRRQNKIVRVLSDEETKTFFHGHSQRRRLGNAGFAHENVDNYAYDKDGWEIKKSQFQINWGSILGSGSSGIVVRGKVRDTEVAVKTTKNSAEIGSQLRALLSEIKVLQHIGQCENIVNMVGSNTSKLSVGNVYLFLEFCPLGSLDKYLRAHRCRTDPSPYLVVDSDDKSNDATKSALRHSQLLEWCLQITDAMMYLQTKKVIHADIAARNVLLMSEDKVKLSDFGLSRRLNEYSSYVKKHQEPLPWRHMAIEALKELSFSHQSDVWSLGITFWEIFSLGDVPYPGFSWTPDFIQLLEDNLRPSKPNHATDAMFTIIKDCWNFNPNSRPTFSDIHDRLIGQIHNFIP